VWVGGWVGGRVWVWVCTYTHTHTHTHTNRATLQSNTLTGNAASIVAEEGAMVRCFNNIAQDAARREWPGATEGEAGGAREESAVLSPRGGLIGATPAGLGAGKGGGGGGMDAQTPRGGSRSSATLGGGAGGDSDGVGGMGKGGVPVAQQLRDKVAFENERQLTPRKDTGYQALLTPRHAPSPSVGDGGGGGGHLPTPRGHVSDRPVASRLSVASRSLALPERTRIQLPMNTAKALEAFAAAENTHVSSSSANTATRQSGRAPVHEGDVSQDQDASLATTRSVHPSRGRLAESGAVPSEVSLESDPCKGEKAVDAGGGGAGGGGGGHDSRRFSAVRELSRSSTAASESELSASRASERELSASSSASANGLVQLTTSLSASSSASTGSTASSVRARPATAPPRPAAVPSLKLERVQPTISGEQNTLTNSTPSSRGPGGAGSGDGGGGGFLANVPRVAEEMATPR
jgi:hypothetical protein